MPPYALISTLAVALQRLWDVLLPLGRTALGWVCVVVGVVVTISPIPFGFVVVIAGVVLLGARNRGLRATRVAWKRLLRRWAALPFPALASVGQRLQRAQRALERRMRHPPELMLPRAEATQPLAEPTAPREAPRASRQYHSASASFRRRPVIGLTAGALRRRRPPQARSRSYTRVDGAAGP
jgi:hypothetical protein